MKNVLRFFATACALAAGVWSLSVATHLSHVICCGTGADRRARRSGADQRSHRDGGGAAAGSPGHGRDRRHDYGARHQRRDAAPRRTGHEGDRPEGGAGHSRVDGGARPFHGRWRRRSKPEARRRHELGRHRPHGRRSRVEGTAGRVDSRARLAPGEVVEHAVAQRRRLSGARGAQPGFAEQPGLADSRERSRRLCEREGDATGEHQPHHARSAGGRHPARQGWKRDGTLQRDGAGADWRRPLPFAGRPHARRSRSRSAHLDRTRIPGGARERPDDRDRRRLSSAHD